MEFQDLSTVFQDLINYIDESCNSMDTGCDPPQVPPIVLPTRGDLLTPQTGAPRGSPCQDTESLPISEQSLEDLIERANVSELRDILDVFEKTEKKSPQQVHKNVCCDNTYEESLRRVCHQKLQLCDEDIDIESACGNDILYLIDDMFNELFPEEATVSETSNEVKEENEVDSVEEKPVSVTTTYGDINITLSSSSDDITEEPPEQEPSDTCLVITIAERNQRNFIQQLINLRDEVDRRRTQVTQELDEEKKKTKKIHGNLKDLEKKKLRYQVCFQKKFGNLRKVKRLKRQMRREIEVLKENSVHRFEEIENCRPQTLPNRTFYVKLLKVCPCNCNAKQNLITVRYLVNTTTLLGKNIKKIHRKIDEEMVARFDAKENVSELTE